MKGLGHATSSRTALIVGAGIGGLAAAVSLRRAGWRVRVFERAESPRELGFALNLAPNAMAALGEIGLAEPLLREGHAIGLAEMRRLDGAVLKRLDVSRALARARQVMALRPVLHGALLDAVGMDALVLGREATGFEVTGSGVAVTLAGGSSEEGDVLIGADGIGSIVRRRLRPAEGPPRASGYVAVRGVAHDAAHRLGALSAVSYLGRGVEAAVVRASASAVYWFMSLLAEDVRGRGDAPALADWCAAEVVSDPVFRDVLRATPRDDMRIDELCDRDPIDVWGAGPVTLLGDAAHPMLPHSGQGAAQALEDAVALGLALAAPGDPVPGLRRYEHVRSRRTGVVVKRGRRIARSTTTKSRFVNGMRTAVIRLVPSRAIVATFMMAGRTDPHRDLR